MYEGMGYCVYRTVAGYYAGGVKEGEEDAYGEFPLFCCTRLTSASTLRYANMLFARYKEGKYSQRRSR